MYQSCPTTVTPTLNRSHYPSAISPDHCFDHLEHHARNAACHSYRSFFQQNRQQIAERCRGRDPHAYRTDRDGCRWENNRVAQTQISDQTANGATIQAGNNRITINKGDSSLRIQNSDGTENHVDLKFWGDPHVQQDGREIGTLKKDVALTLKDGTQVHLLMGDGNGGKPRPGSETYVDSAAIRSPDGTGALVTGISGRGDLAVSLLDSSLSSEFMAGRAMNKFGHYEPSHVAVDRRGNMIDQTNGQMIYDQAGLNRLDDEHGSRAAAQSFLRQGYVPRDLADDYDRPFNQFSQDMLQSCMREMQRMFQQYQRMCQHMPGIDGFSMPFARYGMPDLHSIAARMGLLA
ncbi:DUF1521 domain-containing protein [Xylophilus sp. Kf1]|nr:DUF1521 domain-containing protein [Xylophilus sp. Kf1]